MSVRIAVRRRVGMMILALGIATLALPSSTHAGRFAAGAGFGIGYLPMTDWENFAGGPHNEYDADAVALYAEVYGRIPLADRHGLSVSLERVTKSASIGGPKPFALWVQWDFTAVPINLTYEFSPRGWTSGTTPFFGLGVGAYFSEVTSYASSTKLPPTHGKRDGWGYGVHGYIGQRVAMTQSLAIAAKIRGRIADGMYFTDDDGDIDVDFTGVDLTAALEFIF